MRCAQFIGVIPREGVTLRGEEDFTSANLRFILSHTALTLFSHWHRGINWSVNGDRGVAVVPPFVLRVERRHPDALVLTTVQPVSDAERARLRAEIGFLSLVTQLVIADTESSEIIPPCNQPAPLMALPALS